MAASADVAQVLGVPVADVLATYTLDGPATSLEDSAVIVSRSSCDQHLGMFVQAAAQSPSAAVEWMASAARACLPEMRDSFPESYSASRRVGTDDDDDEEDDDEFYFPAHADDFVLAVAKRMSTTYERLRGAGASLGAASPATLPRFIC